MSGDSIRSAFRARYISYDYTQEFEELVIHNMLNPENRQNNKELLPEEIRDAEEKIVQRAQQEAFREEYEALERKKPIQHSILLKLNPMLDEQGLMRSEFYGTPNIFPMMFDSQ